MQFDFSKVKPESPLAAVPVGNPKVLDIYGGANAATNFYDGGLWFGGVVGCAVGGLATIELQGVGCNDGAVVGGTIIGGFFAAMGFTLGTFDLPGADLFDWTEEQQITVWWEK